MFQGSEPVKPNDFVVTLSGSSILFKEWDLVVDEEDEVVPT